MNLRIGAFGRQEAMSAVWICAFASGCFAFDNRALFWDGNASYPEHALAAALAAELALGRDLSSAVRGAKAYVHDAIERSYLVGENCGVLGFAPRA